MSERIDCATFDEAVGELALELLPPAERDALMAHAAVCGRCRAELESLATLTDHLTTLAPECEPPLGFEQRAIERMVGAPARTQHRRSLLLAAAAATLLIVGVSGVLVGRATLGSDPSPGALEQIGIHDARSAMLLDVRGREHGSVLLTDGPELLLTMRLANLDVGTYHCVVVSADGTSHDVAAWPIGDSGSGVWVVPLDRSLAGATQVLLTEDDGSTLAVARFD